MSSSILNTPYRRGIQVAWVAGMIILHLCFIGSIILAFIRIPMMILILVAMTGSIGLLGLEIALDSLIAYIKTGDSSDEGGIMNVIWGYPIFKWERQEEIAHKNARELREAERVLKEEGIL